MLKLTCLCAAFGQGFQHLQYLRYFTSYLSPFINPIHSYDSINYVFIYSVGGYCKMWLKFGELLRLVSHLNSIVSVQSFVEINLFDDKNLCSIWIIDKKK